MKFCTTESNCVHLSGSTRESISKPRRAKELNRYIEIPQILLAGVALRTWKEIDNSLGDQCEPNTTPEPYVTIESVVEHMDIVDTFYRDVVQYWLYCNASYA